MLIILGLLVEGYVPTVSAAFRQESGCYLPNSIVRTDNVEVADIPISVEINRKNYENAKDEFNRNQVYEDIYSHVKVNNKQLSTNEAQKLANEIVDKIQIANEQPMYYSNAKVKSRDTELTVVDLGQVVDGELVNNKPDYEFQLPNSNDVNLRYVPDSRTSIISEYWKVRPYEASKVLWCRYTTSWTGLDLYKSSDSGTHSVENTYEVSKSMGFNANGKITLSKAKECSLAITASSTQRKYYKGGKYI